MLNNFISFIVVFSCMLLKKMNHLPIYNSISESQSNLLFYFTCILVKEKKKSIALLGCFHSVKFFFFHLNNFAISLFPLPSFRTFHTDSFQFEWNFFTHSSCFFLLLFSKGCKHKIVQFRKINKFSLWLMLNQYFSSKEKNYEILLKKLEK